MSGTGLKKCMPTTRSGWEVAEAIWAIDRELVLDARIVPAAASASRRLKASRLSLSFSGMASMTTSARASSPALGIARIRPR
jgi:hypothetical protein